MSLGDESLTVGAKYALQLGATIDELEVSFATGGTFELAERPSVKLNGSDRPITIQPSSGELRDLTQRAGPDDVVDLIQSHLTAREKEDLRLGRQAEDLRALTSQMPPAPFGLGKETKYDASVRDALQLKADAFQTNIPSDALAEIARCIREDLHLQTEITLKPYSLNVYQKGGLFLKHKDTPRGGDVFGTLVIALPSLFEGGELEVTRGSEKCSFFVDDSDRTSASTTKWWGRGAENGKKVLWSAFYADVDHEIRKVTGGVRVTLAYLIQHGQPGALPHQVLTQQQHKIVEQKMEEALKDKEFMPGGGKLGFHCEHFYTNNEFAGHSSSSPLTAEEMCRLKGRDLIVANAASALGFAVSIVPFLSYAGDEDMYELKLSKFPSKRPCPHQMDPSDIELFFPIAEEAKGRASRPFDGYMETAYRDSADVWIGDDGYGDEDYEREGYKRQFFGHIEYNRDGCFGNEAEETDFYVNAALHINIPAYSERKQLQEKTN